jgi:glutathione synthase/RimK-type ligase-like ATP-grasp enzyme
MFVHITIKECLMPRVAYVSFTHTKPSSEFTGFWAEIVRHAEETGEMTYVGADFGLLTAQTTLLEETGIILENVGWNDPTVDWEAYSAIVIRSTWDYHYSYPQFLAWLDRVEKLPMWNQPAVIRWNSDKHYLRELATLGVRIPPSVWVETGDTANIANIMREQNWTSAIAKPCVGAGAHGLLRYDTVEQAEAGQAEFASAVAESALLVQALIPQITTEGEWSFLFFMGSDGTPQFSHAIQKIPASGDIRVQSGVNTPQSASEGIIEQARDMLMAAQSLFRTPILYARVDAVPINGVLVLMELELIEPYFFFKDMGDDTAPAERFIRALQVVLG